MAVRAFRSLSVSFASPSRRSYARLLDQDQDLFGLASPAITGRNSSSETATVRLGGPSPYSSRKRSGWRVRLQPAKLRLIFRSRRKTFDKLSSSPSSTLAPNRPRAAVQNFLAGPSDQLSEEEKRRRECVDMLRKLSASVRAPSYAR